MAESKVFRRTSVRLCVASLLDHVGENSPRLGNGTVLIIAPMLFQKRNFLNHKAAFLSIIAENLDSRKKR